MAANTTIGTWDAFTYPADFVPHIYVTGTIPTDGEKPVVELAFGQQGKHTNILVLELHPSVVDPKGQDTLHVTPYSQRFDGRTIDTVEIRDKKFGTIAVLQIVQRARGR